MRRWVSGFVLGWILLPMTALAAERQERAAVPGANPDPATSFVVFDYPIDSHSLLRSGYPMVFMANVVTPKGKDKNAWQIGRKSGMQVLEVPAGSYYVRQMTADYAAFPSTPGPVPKNDAEWLKIPPGVVAYLGDVSWSTDIGLQMSFSKRGLLELQKMDELHSKPLMLVAFGQEPRPVSWD